MPSYKLNVSAEAEANTELTNVIDAMEKSSSSSPPKFLRGVVSDGRGGSGGGLGHHGRGRISNRAARLAMLLLLLLLALVLVVGVALMVFFFASASASSSSSRELTCKLDEGLASAGIQDAVTSCKEWVENGGTASEDICNVCPSSQPPPSTATPTSSLPGTVIPTLPPYDRRHYRLPSTLTPSHYALRLQPHFYGTDPSAFFFEGSVTIDVTCHDVTDVITLHALSLTIEDSDVTVREKASGVSVDVREISYEAAPEFYHLHLASSLREGVEYQVMFARFSGPLKNDNRGLFYTSYIDGDTVVYLAASWFEPTRARKAFPCFDEPSMKATFSITLVRKSDTGRNYHTLSNMDRIRTDASPLSPGWEEDVYQTTMKMSTFLVGVLVSDFDRLTNTTNSVRFSTWSPPNTLHQVTAAHELGLKVFEFCETRFRPSYTTYLDKLDTAAAPFRQYAGVDNWGVVLYGDSALHRSGVTTAFDDQYTAYVIAHEIAHIWFGNMMTPRWWNSLWLKESMASFWNMQIIDEMYPKWRMTDENLVGYLYDAMTSDALVSSHPVISDVESPAEILWNYDYIIYGKGAFLIRMMHFIMGADKFIDGLNILVMNHTLGNVHYTDLWAALDTFSPPGVDMAVKMDPWVTQMGYPVVMVTRGGNGMLHLEQRRFLLDSEADTDPRYRESPYGYQWEIPITVASSKDPNFTKTGDDIDWLEKGRPLTSLADPTEGDDRGWFVVNVQQYGYYHVHYDQHNWLNLIHQLNSDHKVIHPINRAQIINDAWNLVKADMLDMETALKTVEFLSKETDFLPWKAFAREMTYVELLLDRSELHSAIETFILDLVSGPLQQLGLDINTDLDPLDVYVRTLLAELACSHGHPTCVNLAQQQFNDWMTTGNNGINANHRYLFYCTAVQRRGQAEWNFALDKLQAEKDVAEKPRLRHALSCTTDPALLRRLLNMAMNRNDSHVMDFPHVVADVSANRLGRDISFQFVEEHFSSLALVLGSGMSGVISSITQHFSSEYDLRRLDMLESSGDTSAVASAIKQAQTKSRANIKWLQTHLTTLQNWLQREEEKGERINYRLPAHVRPTHYQLQLQPHMYGNQSSAFTFEGDVVIHLDCISDTDVITMHVDRLTILDDDISVRQVNSQKQLFQSSSYEQLRHFWRLQLAELLQAGKKYVVEIRHFSGPLSADGNGLYLSTYRDGEDTVYLATSQMSEVYARKTFPCFDEPQLKATFDITLVRRNDTGRNYNSMANSPFLDTEYMQDTEGHWWAKDRFERTPIMPTYLLAFIVSDFTCGEWENRTISDPNVTYRTCARPNAVQWAERAQGYGLKLFDWLNTHFKPKYSQALSKLDNVAVPDFNSGAMENWDLINYREEILYQPGVTSARYENWMASILTHEIAHTWFGNYVSPKWWNWIWLNEAFASWWGIYGTQQMLPDWDFLKNWVSSRVYDVMESDAMSTSHPLTVDVTTPSQIGTIFDAVTYSKGTAIVRMMHFIMGFDTFVDGLNLYLSSHLYGNADAADLFAALDQKMREQQFGSEYMTTKMDPWVSQMGYPVVMVTRTASGYHLTQKRFLIGSAETVDDRYKDAPYNYQWEIPIIYATSENANMEKSRNDIHWLSKNSDLLIADPSVNDTDAWILLNVEQVVYCRVLYDTATWQALTGQLNRDPSVIPAINRGQIINDAWNLVKAGLLEMSVALSTLDFLQSETELVPWRAFAREMNYVELMLERTDLFPLLQTFMRDSLQKPFETLNLNIDDNMAPTDVFVRTLIAEYACRYGLVGCVNVAKRLFTEWKNTGINEIHVNLRRLYYCTAVAEGDVTDWRFAYTQYRSADDSIERSNLRLALSCAGDPALLRRLLNMALDPALVQVQDIDVTIRSVAENPAGRDLAFQFFVEHFDHLKNSLENRYFGLTLTSVTSHFNTEYGLQQLQQLSRVRDVIRSALDQAMTQTRANTAWLRDHYDVIKDWLTLKLTPSAPSPPAPGAYRLPTDLSPSHYTLSLQPHIYGNNSEEFCFEGNVTIFFICNSPTTTITLHQDRLTIDPSSITVTRVVQPNVAIPVDRISEEELFHFYKIHMQNPLMADQSYSVQFLNFRGQMRTSGEGLYLSSYKDGDHTLYLATTQMEPTYARQVFPCFDEPAMKATFTTSLLRRTDTGRHYITLSNMPNVSSEVIDQSWTADTFEETTKMSTYLLAFIVCDYLHLSNFSTQYPVEIRTYVQPSRIEEAATAQSYSVALFDWYNGHFQPRAETFISKIDHFVLPDPDFEARAHWGLNVYPETLLYNSMSTASDRSLMAAATSHQLAHLWFGNKVSPKWWTWLWLNEAFASYWESYAVEQLYPNTKENSVLLLAWRVSWIMMADSYSTSRPLSHPVETPAQIRSLFDEVTPVKGFAVVKMMHMIMGEHFIPALNEYLRDNVLENVEHKDLFDSLNKYIRNTAGIDVNMTEKMEPWVTQMGYPVVHVHRQGDRLHLSQQRFLLGSTSPADIGAYGYKYEVPITYTTSSEKNFNKPRTDIHWLRANGSPLTIQMTSSNDEWVVVNLRHQGYYRVNYDIATWEALIAQLNTDHTVFDQMNRAALMDDAFNLVTAELLPLEIALRTLDYMKNETDYGPWRLFERVTCERDQLCHLVERTKLLPHYQRFMQDLVDGPLQTLGLDPPVDNDPPIQVFTMRWIIRYACKYDHMTCVTKATSMVSDWMSGLGNSMNVNLRSTFYCTAVREGGHDVWDFIYNKYQEELDPTEKSRLRSALGCSKDPTILNTFLDMCLYDEDVPRAETPSCVSAVAGNRFGRDVTVNFVWEHFAQLKDSQYLGINGQHRDSALSQQLPPGSAAVSERHAGRVRHRGDTGHGPREDGDHHEVDGQTPPHHSELAHCQVSRFACLKKKNTA